jgi:undecaprenyl phosphate-alpha-L-ara4N flippase subunit ArnE
MSIKVEIVNYLNIILLLMIIIIETLQQVFFKLSAQKQDKKYFFTFLGIVMYLLYLVAWFKLLKTVPLGIALPVMGLNYVAVAFSGKLIFKEEIDLKRWCGIILIFGGLVLVGMGGASFL